MIVEAKAMIVSHCVLPWVNLNECVSLWPQECSAVNAAVPKYKVEDWFTNQLQVNVDFSPWLKAEMNKWYSTWYSNRQVALTRWTVEAIQENQPDTSQELWVCRVKIAVLKTHRGKQNQNTGDSKWDSDSNQRHRKQQIEANINWQVESELGNCTQ